MAKSNSTDRPRPTSSTERRCTAQTRKGSRCKSKALVYHQHKDGSEYLACLLHHNEHFRPAAGVHPRPPDTTAGM